MYNAVYRDSKNGVVLHKTLYLKQRALPAIKNMILRVAQPFESAIYFTANPNGEAEVIRIALKPKPRLFKLVFEKDFSDIAIVKGVVSMGNILTKTMCTKSR